MCKFHVFKPIYIAIFEKNDDLDYFEKKKWRSLQGGTLVFYLSSLQGDPCVSFFFNWQESTLEKKKKIGRKITKCLLREDVRRRMIYSYVGSSSDVTRTSSSSSDVTPTYYIRMYTCIHVGDTDGGRSRECWGAAQGHGALCVPRLQDANLRRRSRRLPPRPRVLKVCFVWGGWVRERDRARDRMNPNDLEK